MEMQHNHQEAPWELKTCTKQGQGVRKIHSKWWWESCSAQPWRLKVFLHQLLFPRLRSWDGHSTQPAFFWRCSPIPKDQNHDLAARVAAFTNLNGAVLYLVSYANQRFPKISEVNLKDSDHCRFMTKASGSKTDCQRWLAWMGWQLSENFSELFMEINGTIISKSLCCVGKGQRSNHIHSTFSTLHNGLCGTKDSVYWAQHLCLSQVCSDLLLMVPTL